MPCNYLASFRTRTTIPKTVKQSGFGLIELMVSISIMAIVMAIVFTNQNSFNGAILLRSQAYEIALELREIQLSAVSAVSDGSGEFRSVLGVHFDTSNDGEYKIFRDAPTRNGFYDSGEEFGIQGVVDGRFEIRSISANGNAVSAVSVIFVRPNFDARFFSDSFTEIAETSIEIVVARRGSTGTGPGDVRTVEITSTGQIAVI